MTIGESFFGVTINEFTLNRLSFGGNGAATEGGLKLS